MSILIHLAESILIPRYIPGFEPKVPMKNVLLFSTSNDANRFKCASFIIDLFSFLNLAWSYPCSDSLQNVNIVHSLYLFLISDITLKSSVNIKVFFILLIFSALFR